MIRLFKDIVGSVKTLGEDGKRRFTNRYNQFVQDRASAKDKSDAEYVAAIESTVYSKFLHGTDSSSIDAYRQTLQKIESDSDYIDEAYKYHYTRMGQLETLKENVGPELRIPDNAKIKWLIELNCSNGPTYDASTNLTDDDLNREIADMCNKEGGKRKRVRKTKKRVTKKRVTKKQRLSRRKTTFSY